jgi:hypothetical protein
VPVQNDFGGFVYAGPTMAFTAGYWALGALKPDVIAYLGCDMQYSHPETHFYGKGSPDPLRPELEVSRQVFPRIELTQLDTLTLGRRAVRLKGVQANINKERLKVAQQLERDLGYIVTSGRTWELSHMLDGEKLRQLDALWLGTFNP